MPRSDKRVLFSEKILRPRRTGASPVPTDCENNKACADSSLPPSRAPHVPPADGGGIPEVALRQLPHTVRESTLEDGRKGLVQTQFCPL